MCPRVTNDKNHLKYLLTSGRFFRDSNSVDLNEMQKFVSLTSSIELLRNIGSVILFSSYLAYHFIFIDSTFFSSNSSSSPHISARYRPMYCVALSWVGLARSRLGFGACCLLREHSQEHGSMEAR